MYLFCCRWNWAPKTATKNGIISFIYSFNLRMLWTGARWASREHIVIRLNWAAWAPWKQLIDKFFFRLDFNTSDAGTATKLNTCILNFASTPNWYGLLCSSAATKTVAAATWICVFHVRTCCEFSFFFFFLHSFFSSTSSLLELTYSVSAFMITLMTTTWQHIKIYYWPKSLVKSRRWVRRVEW